MPFALPPPIITFNGTLTRLHWPIGVSVALSEDGGFSGAQDVRWTVEGPAGSLTALTVENLIGAGPFTNAFIPDVPGDFLFRLVITYPDGTTAEATAVMGVDLPYSLGSGAEFVPAPGETTERDDDRGWADGPDTLLHRVDAMRRGCEIVAFVNGSGGALANGTIINLAGLIRWAELTGGVAVVGSPQDYLLGAVPGVGQAMLGMVIGSVANGAKGYALRRGMMPFDCTGFGFAPGAGGLIYFNGEFALPVETATPYPLGRCLFLGATANPAGFVAFDPGPTEAKHHGGTGQVTLLDNSGTTDVDSALEWDAVDIAGFSLRYSIVRGNTAAVGRIMAAVNPAVPECTLVNGMQQTTTITGVAFLATAAAGRVKLQYQTTATGTDATMTWVVEEVWAR